MIRLYLCEKTNTLKVSGFSGGDSELSGVLGFWLGDGIF